MTDLKPCPFCGGEAELISDMGTKDMIPDPITGDPPCTIAYTRCTNTKCRAGGMIADSCDGGTESDAIAAWNRRSGGSEWYKSYLTQLAVAQQEAKQWYDKYSRLRTEVEKVRDEIRTEWEPEDDMPPTWIVRMLKGHKLALTRILDGAETEEG